MQKYPIEMQHGSGKLLQNIGSDYISRNPPDCKDSNCSVCHFANERGELLLSVADTLVAPELDLSNIQSLTLSSAKDIPIGNTNAWYNLQINNPAISEAIRYRRLGQQPPKTGSIHVNEIKFYVRKCTISPKTQLLVKEEEIPYETRKVERILVPKIFLEPLLTQIHHDQSCPTVNQMKKLYARYFYAYEPGDVFEQITSNCKICQSNRVLPKEIKHFSSVTKPSSPGTIFVIDVMNRAKQSIIVCRDAFSDFVTTAILKSEKAEDLKDGLIAATSADKEKVSLVKIMHSLRSTTQTKLSSTPLEALQTDVYVASRHNSPRRQLSHSLEDSTDRNTIPQHSKNSYKKKEWCPVQSISSSDDSTDSETEDCSLGFNEDQISPDNRQDQPENSSEGAYESNDSLEASHVQQSSMNYLNTQIVIDYSEEPSQPEHLLQVHDVIAFYHGSKKTWVRATLLSNELRGHKNYYNIRYDTGKLDGVFLIKGERWTFLYGSDLPPASNLRQVSRNGHPVDLFQVHNLNHMLPLPPNSYDDNATVTRDYPGRRIIQHIRPRVLLPMEQDHSNQLSSEEDDLHNVGSPRHSSWDEP